MGSKVPFRSAILNLRRLFGVSFLQADQMVQDTYSDFKRRNEKLGQRQDDSANQSYVSLIAHSATLATLTITVLGFLASQYVDKFSTSQKILLLLIIIVEAFAIFLGVIDYLQTIKFHEEWSLIYHNIDNEIDKKFSTGDLQLLSELNEIEVKHIKKGPKKTRVWVTYGMIGLTLLGLVLVIMLFYTFLFDVPGNWR